MSQKRVLFFQILAPLVVLYTIYHSWGFSEEDSLPKPDLPSEEFALETTSSLPGLEEKVLLTQTKILLGILYYFEEKKALLQEAALPYKEVKTQIETVFRDSVLKHSQAPPMLLGGTQKSSRSIRLIQKEIILAEYLGESNIVFEKYLELNKKTKQSELDRKLNSILKNALGLSAFSPHNSGKNLPKKQKLPLSTEEQEVVDKNLGLFGSLLGLIATNQSGTKARLEKKIREESVYAFQKLAVGMIVGAVLGIIGITSCLVILFRFFSGKMVFQFSKIGSFRDFSLEIFCLYLATMVLGAKVLTWIGSKFPELNMLKGNAILVLGTLLILLWPSLFGAKFSELRKAIGLRTGGTRKFFADVLLAPFFYLGSWVILIFILIAYSIIIQILNVDITQGTHPIVPIIASSQNTQTIFLIVFLAVIVAPIVEEIMFRGVLYGWIREHSGRGFAMISSALLFAAVHPQGAIGIIPLASIGFFLAFLREWRGSLIAPMVAHGCYNAGTLTLVLFFFH